MQGVVFMPQNPQQGSPPPNNSSLDSDMTMENLSPSSKEHPKDKLSPTNDSGIFSATSNTTMDSSRTTTTENCDALSDNRSECSSPDNERKYVCPICDAVLTSQHQFTLHIRSHNDNDHQQEGQGGFTCCICYKVLSSSSSLDRHVLVHSGERPFHCKFCGDTFTTNGNMHRHMRTHNHKMENYESDGSSDAGSSTKSITEYNNNKIENYNKRKLDDKDEDDDEEEEKCIAVKQKLEEDAIEEIEKNSYKCPVCERADFDSIQILETHLQDNHPEYPAKCNQCNLIFSNNKQLTGHKATVHESTSPKLVFGFKDLTHVDFSSEKFPHIARMECEKNLHKVSGGLKFQCRKCLRAFPCANSLEIHETDCLNESGGLDLSGSLMSEREIRRNEFFSRLNLQDTSPEKAFSLNETSNKLRQQLLAKAMNFDSTKDLADIQSIISMTSNGSLLQQLQANKSDSLSPLKANSEDLNRSGEQEEETQDLFAVEFRKMKLRGEFPCRLCTAVFPNLRALKGHNRAHLNGNNNGMYRCNMCPHSSIDKAALIRHMRTHNGDRPYECSLCNYAFTTKANCERHLRNRHAKSTREEVKKAIIYHPSEDPTNEDLNKLTNSRDEMRKDDTNSGDSNKFHCATPKLTNDFSSLKSEITPLIPNLLKESLNVPLEQPKLFSKITDIIRSENLKSLKDHRLQNGYLSAAATQAAYNFAPKPSNVSTPTAKIHVKSLEELKETSFEQSDDEPTEDEPMDLVLDLSKKNNEKTQKKSESLPEDLSRRNLLNQQLNVSELFAQRLLKTPPKIDPATFYATQLALYQQSFPGWPPFPINPLLFQSLQNPLLGQEAEMKERLQRYNLCGGSMVADMKSPSFSGYKMTEAKSSAELSYDSPKRSDDLKPLSLNVDTNFNEKLQSSPIPKQEQIIQSPNSVKMVIKNGVLMPKQKQRRYRTERPFTCEHCSARFTLRSNMERHIKQQHPQFWSARQRGHVSNVGRKSSGNSQSLHHPQMKTTNYCDLSIPNYDLPKTQQHQDYDDTKEHVIDEKLKFALLAQHLRGLNSASAMGDTKKEDEDDCALIIDENAEKTSDGKTDNTINDETNNQRLYENYEKSRILEDKLKQLHAKQMMRNEIKRGEEDLVPVSRLLDNASQQPFKDYFKREQEEPEVSEEDEEGLVASGSTSEGNISGTDENKSESETSVPVKKKSAYSMAPNRVSCPFCSRKFPWSSSLRRHILTHTGQKPFKCSHCPLLFTTKSNCDRHLLRKHGNNATTISNTDSTNNNNNNNTNYLMRNVPERPFKCSNCPSSTFSTYSNLKKHISCKHAQCDDDKAQGYDAGSSEDEKVVPNDNHHQNWEIPLSKASEATTTSSNASSDLPFKCHLCEGSFGERQDALDHIKDKHYSEYDLLLSKNALDLNATTPDESGHHDDDESEMRGKFPDYSNRKVICAFCMRRFWSAEDLRRHMRTHTGERPFSCDICRRRFTLKHSMLRHRKKHNVNFDNETVNSDEDVNQVATSLENFNNNNIHHAKEESDGNEGGDLISNLLGIRDRSFIDKVLTASADDAAKLLGVKNGVKE